MSNFINDGIDRSARQQRHLERPVPEAQFQTFGFFIGQVMDDVDDQQMGRVWCHLPDYSAQRSDRDSLPLDRKSPTRKKGPRRNADVIDYEERFGWILCYPLFPYFGSDGFREAPEGGRTPRDGESNSYGMWFQPRVGDFVGVLFANGDPSRAYWIGMVPKYLENFMVPGHAAERLGEGPSQINGKTVDLKVTEETGPAHETSRPQSTPRRASKVFRDNLIQAGLQQDELRGAGRSSSRRESPSRVLGLKSPGDPESLMMGHQLVMDDLPKYQGVRLRTSKGGQIYINDTCNFIYVNTQQGNVWVQLEDTGHVKVFAGESISLHAMRDFNLVVERDMNVEVRGDMRWLVKGDARIEYQGSAEITTGSEGGDLLIRAYNDLSLLAEENIRSEARQNYNIKAGEEIREQAGADIAVTAGGVYREQAALVFMNTGAGSPADEASIPDVIALIEQYGPPAYPNLAPGGKQGYVPPIVPQHEPWTDITNPCAEAAVYDGLVAEDDDPPTRSGASSEDATKPDDLNTPDGVKRGVEYETDSKAEAPQYTTEATNDAFAAANTYSLSQEGLDAIKREEGFRPCSYNDVGRRAIGYGHNVRPGENIPECISKEQAEALLMQDTAEFERCVKSGVTQNITQAQYDAMVSLAYNVGCSGFRNSTAVRELNAGNHEKVPEAWMRWTTAGGQKNVPVLVARRQRELAMFNKITPPPAS